MQSTSKSSGFTLVELAVVLVILGFLVGGLLVPLATQVEQRNRRETEQQLEEIRQALLGFVVAYGYLPCPTTEENPLGATYGVTDPACAAPIAEGYLPWKTLGLREVDAWGITRDVTGYLWTGYFRYRVHPKFANSATPITLTTKSPPGTELSVQDSDGTPMTINSEPPVAVICSTGPNRTPDGQNAGAFNAIYQGGTPTPNFDDLTIWISRPVVFEKLVSAGRIP